MDSSGDIVEMFGNINNEVRLEPHDFEIVEDGRKIVQTASILHDREDGVIEEAAFQEVDIATRTVEFEWRSLDHVPRNQTFVGLDEPDY